MAFAAASGHMSLNVSCMAVQAIVGGFGLPNNAQTSHTIVDCLQQV